MSWLSRMFPWPAKHERRAAIAAARAEKERSRATAAESAKVRQQLARLAKENHYSEAIQNQIMRGYQG